jgi:AcrR family transcriptional regulator
MADTSGRIINVNGRNRRPWALQSRERILKAAIDEIAEVGFEKARLVDIAKRADLTVGSIYTWFENKEDLFRAALEDALEAQLLSNAAALAGVPELNQDKWLYEIANLVPRNHEDDTVTVAQRLMIESYYASWRDVDAREKLLPRLRTHVQMYVDIIERAQADGAVRTDIDTLALAMVMAAVPLGMSMLNLAGFDRIKDSVWMPIILGVHESLKPSAEKQNKN